jgi:hypothetical protein
MRNHFVRRGTLEMRCRSKPAGGIADAQYDQVRTALLRNFHDPIGWLTVFHGHLRREIKLRVVRNYFVEPMNYLSHRQFKYSVVGFV